MKKTLKVIAVGAAALTLSLASLLGACGEGADPTPQDPTGHSHTYAKEWSFDHIGHWHAATCDHILERSNEGAHTPDADGICSTCGYHSFSSIAEFQENYAETAIPYVRSPAMYFDEKTVSSEFIWFKSDSVGKLTDYTYLFTASKDDGSTKYVINSSDGKGLNNVWLDEVANGAALHGGVMGSTSNVLPPYDASWQEESGELAQKIVSVCAQKKGETASYTPLLRLCSIQHTIASTSGGTQLVYSVVDICNTGYIYYSIKDIDGEESDINDTSVLLEKLDGDIPESHCVIGDKYANLGTLVYHNIKN